MFSEQPNLNWIAIYFVSKQFVPRPKPILDREQMCIDMGFVSADSMSQFVADEELPSSPDTYVSYRGNVDGKGKKDQSDRPYDVKYWTRLE